MCSKKKFNKYYYFFFFVKKVANFARTGQVINLNEDYGDTYILPINEANRQ